MGMSISESETMIDLGYGGKLPNPVFTEELDGATLSYCMQENGCVRHPVVKTISNRISSLLSIPIENFQYLTVNKISSDEYTVNDYHNFDKEQVDSQCGPSIISFALFLSDTKQVESDEGGISFHDLNIKDSRMFYDTQGISNGATYYLHTIAHLY